MVIKYCSRSGKLSWRIFLLPFIFKVAISDIVQR
jgi:hypothetical protein